MAAAATKKFKEDKFRCGLLLLQQFFLNVWIMTSTLDDKSIFQVSTYKGLKIHNFFQIITNLCFDR